MKFVNIATAATRSSEDFKDIFDEERISLETDCSNAYESNQQKFSPIVPKRSKFLFSDPPTWIEKNYFDVFAKVENAIIDLENTEKVINIRDDYSIQPRTVQLNLPRRRFTSLSY